jgi:hypothetical protein
VDVGRNAGGTHAGHTPGIYIHSTLAVLALSNKIRLKTRLDSALLDRSRLYYSLVREIVK